MRRTTKIRSQQFDDLIPLSGLGEVSPDDFIEVPRIRIHQGRQDATGEDKKDLGPWKIRARVRHIRGDEMLQELTRAKHSQHDETIYELDMAVGPDKKDQWQPIHGAHATLAQILEDHRHYKDE